MATRPLIGGSTWNQEVTRLRNAADAQRLILEKAMHPDVGPNLMTAYLAKITWQLTTIYAAVNELERIGQFEKAERTEP